MLHCLLLDGKREHTEPILVNRSERIAMTISDAVFNLAAELSKAGVDYTHVKIGIPAETFARLEATLAAEMAPTYPRADPTTERCAELCLWGMKFTPVPQVFLDPAAPGADQTVNAIWHPDGRIEPADLADTPCIVHHTEKPALSPAAYGARMEDPSVMLGGKYALEVED